MNPVLNIALKAARRAGDIILRAIDRIDTIKISEKFKNDFVTDVDQQAEREIIAIIRANYPNHSILAEESGHSQGDQTVWIIDPLDGTTNFIHGFPHLCVSIGVQINDRMEFGLIYDPLKQEIFSAVRGEGARLNDRRMRISQQQTLEGALIATGLPCRELPRLETYITTLHEIAKYAGDARRTGSAALDLAYTAAGRLDGYWELGLKPWDIAAGSLMVKEAGGLISDIHGEEDYLTTGDIIAANPKVFKRMLQIIKPLQPE